MSDKVVYKKSLLDGGEVIDISVVLHGGTTPYIYVESDDRNQVICVKPETANKLCGHIAAAAHEARKHVAHTE